MAKKKIAGQEDVVMSAEAEAPVAVPDVPAVPVAPVQTSLHEFKMPIRNSCFKCGAQIPQGGRVFAFSMNAVIAGGGFCAKCAGEVG